MTNRDAVEVALHDAIRSALVQFGPDLEFHGELRGLIQHQGRPETATGWVIKLGDGVPAGWEKP